MNELLNREDLIKEGFLCKEKEAVKEIPIKDHQFLLIIKINLIDIDYSYEVIESDTREPFFLFHVSSAHNAFLEELRSEVETEVQNILWKVGYPLSPYLYQGEKAMEIIEKRYGEVATYPFSDHETLALKIKEKWYGLFLFAPGKYFSKKEKEVPVLNVKVQPDTLFEIIDEKKVFPAYHMDKKHWVSYLLSECKVEDLVKALETSRSLVIKEHNIFAK